LNDSNKNKDSSTKLRNEEFFEYLSVTINWMG